MANDQPLDTERRIVTVPDGRRIDVLIAGPDDEVSQKRVTVDTLRGADWIVTGGLADGDRVIVSGTQNARPGSRVVPVAAAADAAPPAAAAASR